MHWNKPPKEQTKTDTSFIISLKKDYIVVDNHTIQSSLKLSNRELKQTDAATSTAEKCCHVTKFKISLCKICYLPGLSPRKLSEQSEFLPEDADFYPLDF